MLSTVQQVGGATGVAVVGVVFFGLLVSQAVPAARAQMSELQDRLSAMGVPDGAIAQFEDEFLRCFEQQAGSQEPGSPAAGCPSPGAGQSGAASEEQEVVGGALGTAARLALADTFSRATWRTILWIEVPLYLVILLLIFALPTPPALLRGPPPIAE